MRIGRALSIAAAFGLCAGCTSTAGGGAPTTAARPATVTVTVTSMVTVTATVAQAQAGSTRVALDALSNPLRHPTALTDAERQVARRLIAQLQDEKGPVAREGDTVRIYGIDAASRSLDVAVGRLDGELHHILAYWIRNGNVVHEDSWGGDDPDVSYLGEMYYQYLPNDDLTFHWRGGQLVQP